MATLPIPPKRMRSGAKRRPRKAREVVPRIVIEDQRATVEEAPALPAEVADGERDPRRYVAVVSQIEGTEAFPAQDEVPLFPSRQRGRAEIETYPTDIPIAITVAFLAVSIFLEWYKGPRGFNISVSGWESGSLAPFIVFLAAGSLTLVVLRRLGVAVNLPVEESLAHEAVGWLSLVAAVVKSRWRPSLVGGVGFSASYGVWIAIGAAALLVVLAGRMSPRAPLVFRPGWHRGRAGTVGLVMLLIVAAGSVAFGITNEPKIAGRSSTRGPQTFPGSVEGLPECAKGFPFPKGVTPDYGFQNDSRCQASLTSEQEAPKVIDALKKSLTAAKWTYKEIQATSSSALFSLSKPRCGSLAVVALRGGTAVALAFTPCPSPTPTRS